MGYDRTLLRSDEVSEFLRTQPGWTMEGKMLVKTYEHASFLRAVDHINRLAQVAESQAHHPDIDLRYRLVTIRLTTHDAGGLTFRDLKLAQAADELYRPQSP
jgi:4a-hydroxytetrahydrobiopterin dehydratase